MKCHLLFWCNVLWRADLDFCATDNFRGTFVNFCFVMFNQKIIALNVCFARMLIHDRFGRMSLHFRKVFSCIMSVRKNFEHSCDQVTFSERFFRIYLHNSDKVVLIQVVSITVGSKQKMKMKTWNTMAP